MRTNIGVSPWRSYKVLARLSIESVGSYWLVARLRKLCGIIVVEVRGGVEIGGPAEGREKACEVNHQDYSTE
jgi:hypothetical protein